MVKRTTQWLSILCGVFLLGACTAAGGGAGGGGGTPQNDEGTAQDTGGDVDMSCLYNEDCPDTGEACTMYLCTESVCVLGLVPDGEACDTDACTVSQTCNAGACEGGDPAPVDCEEGTCAPDACGNECLCPDGKECAEGLCQEPACGDITAEGCCMPGEGVVKWCENDTVQEGDCAGAGGVCTWVVADAFYGCGPPGEVLVSEEPTMPYLCPGETCEGTCDGKSCGTDGCGNTCGVCGEGEFCEEGACLACSCDGKECGVDQCGNECGTCADGTTCVESLCFNDPCAFAGVEGCCKGDVLNYCDNGTPAVGLCAQGCGWDPNGNSGSGWYDCGFEGEDPSGLFPLQCFDPLDPPKCETTADCPTSAEACKEYACGEGVCKLVNTSDGSACDTDACYTSQVCAAGECQGGEILPKDCTGLVCGPDVCGHACGDCVQSMTCEEGQCVPDLPTTYTLKVQPILIEHCSPCHTEQKLGGHNLASSYPDATKDATHPDCVGKNMGECSVIRILGMDMPKDAPGSVPLEDLKILQEWIADGMLL
jgi:hypothetical protein